MTGKDPRKPAVVLVHGAFAESAGWSGVIPTLVAAGHRVVAAANPLRSVAGDAASVASVIDAVGGPVLVVAHSYGGTVISVAAAGREQVIGLVYVAAFAPAIGESTAELTARYPGSTLAETLVRVSLPGGGVDLSIEPSAFHEQYCHDVSPGIAAVMAATQRPVTEAALAERAAAAAWTEIPSSFVIPTADRSIPADAQRFMAERAGSRNTVEIEGASHAVGDSQPGAVAEVILEAAGSARAQTRPV